MKPSGARGALTMSRVTSLNFGAGGAAATRRDKNAGTVAVESFMMGYEVVATK